MDKVLVCVNRECNNYLNPAVPREDKKRHPCPSCGQNMRVQSYKKVHGDREKLRLNPSPEELS